MAGLPGSSAIVWVIPPFEARRPRPGFTTSTWLPPLPLAIPPAPPTPIKLNMLLGETVPAMSSGDRNVPTTWLFRATIVLYSVVAVEPANSPPPPLLSTRFSAIVALTDSIVPTLSMPPPWVLAEFPAMVLSVMISPDSFSMPPPVPPAELFAMTLSSTVRRARVVDASALPVAGAGGVVFDCR